MALTNISAYRIAGETIDDEDIDQNANIEISKLATRTLIRPLSAGAALLNGAGATKLSHGVFGGVTLPNANEVELYFTFPLPDEYDSGNVTPIILWNSGSTGGDVKFTVRVASKTTGEDTAHDEQLTVTTTAPSANTLIVSSVVTTSVTFTKGDIVLLKISRDPGDAADTLAADVRIFAIKFQYTGRA